MADLSQKPLVYIYIFFYEIHNSFNNFFLLKMKWYKILNPHVPHLFFHEEISISYVGFALRLDSDFAPTPWEWLIHTCEWMWPSKGWQLACSILTLAVRLFTISLPCRNPFMIWLLHQWSQYTWQLLPNKKSFIFEKIYIVFDQYF